MNLIGPNVKKIRNNKKLSQKELVAKCNLIGWDISRGTLAKIESQTRRVTDYDASNLAKALKIEIQDLFIS